MVESAAACPVRGGVSGERPLGRVKVPEGIDEAWRVVLYNSWTMIPNILICISSVPHECWGCTETFLGFLRIFNVKLCP